MPQHNSISLQQAVEEEPLAVAPETPLSEVIQLMSRDWNNSCVLRHEPRYTANALAPIHHSCVLAIANSQLAGIFTEQTLVKLISSRSKINGVTLGEVMNPDVITLTANSPLNDAQDIFAALNLFRQYQIRHLPVIDQGNHLLGLITHSSLRQVLRSADLLKLRTVGDIMSRAIHALTETSVLSVAQLMSDYQVSGIPIVEIGTGDDLLYPRGIITERDIIQFQLLELDLAELKAEDVMSTPLYLTTPEDSLWQVSQQMQRHLLRRLVVAGKGGELLGIVTQSSLLRAIEVRDLQGYWDILQTRILQLEQAKTKSLQHRNLKLRQRVSQQTQKLREQAEGEKLVAEVALRIRQSLDLRSILQSTVDEVRQLIQADRVLIYRFEPDWSGLVTTEAVSNPQWSILNRVVKDACFAPDWIKPYQQGRVFSVADIEQAGLSSCHRQFLQSFQVKANAAIPILIHESNSATDRLWGLLIVHQCETTRNWQEAELELLQRLSIQVAIAINQGELYQQANRELKQRRQTEIALRESESRFKNMANTAPVMIWMSDTDKQHTFFNQPWLDFTGRTLEQESGSGWLAGIHPDDRQGCWQQYTTSFDQRQEFIQEYRLSNEAGEYRWILARGVPRYAPNSEFIGYIGSCIDISDRRQTEATLEERETQLRTALDAAALGTWSWDIASNEVLLSPRARLILGCNSQDTYNLEAVLERIHPEERQEIYARATQKIEPEKLYELEARLNLTIGQEEEAAANRPRKSLHHQERWLEVRGQIVLDAERRPTKMMGVVADITEKKQVAEKSLRHQRLESLGALAGGVAHDLNNILTPILMSVQLLPVTLSEIDPRSREIIGMLENNVKRGSALVQQVLSFARGIEGKRGIVQVKHLIRDIRQIATETFPKAIEIRSDVAANLWAIEGDATQIHQILLNLVINARDAMPDGGVLTITATNILLDPASVEEHPQAQVGSYVAISIADTGVGIPAQDLTQIFEPFFTTKDTVGGTGLGLATVQNIVKSHGGVIEVASEVDRGSQFQILIPAAESADPEAREILSLPKGQGELILVVDDEATIREITRASLETHNYRVVTANDGIEAIATYVKYQQDIAVVLMNMMMPGMDGTTAILTLQKINPQLKIIAISGRNFNQQALSDRNLKLEGFLSKPYSTQALLQTLQEVINPEQGDRVL